jgi:hypothetical protein
MKTKLVVVLAAIGGVGATQGAERIRYEEIPNRIAPFGSYIEWYSITVTTVDGVKHPGQELLLEPDHLWLVRKDDSGEELPSYEVARIEIRQRGRFLSYAEAAFFLPLILPAMECEDSHHPVICWTVSSVAFSPMWVTVAAIPFFLAGEGVTFFIPPKVYEIVH